VRIETRGAVVTGVKRSLAMLLLPLFVFPVAVQVPGILGVAAGLALAIACVWGVVALVRTRAKKPIVFDERGVEARGKLVVPRADLTTAYVIPGNESALPRVVITGKSGVVVEMDVGSDQEARSVVASLGKDATHQSVDFVGVSRAGSLTGVALLAAMPLALALFTLGMILQMPALCVVAAVFGLGAPIGLVANTIRIGADGLLVDNRLDSRFVSWQDVASVKPTWRGLSLELENGKSVPVPITSRFYLSANEKDQQQAMLERIEEARRAFATRAVSVAATKLERAGRDVSQWLAALAAPDAGGFRDASMRHEDLLAVLESQASPTARLGAAVMLARKGDETEKARIRIAAEACAEPKLRVALEAAAALSASSASDEELEAAARDVEEEEVDAERGATT
jgi:hypothetical protein